MNEVKEVQENPSGLGAVRAKMQCASIEQWPSTSKVKMSAVYSQTGENKDFCDATPSGECWMQITSARPASKFFVPGKKYYVTFTEAPE